MLINRAFAAKYFKNADPIGRRVRFGGAKSTAPWSTIVGVVGDMFSGDQNDPMLSAMFHPFAQARRSFVYVSARTNGSPMSITPAVRDAIAALNPDIPLYWVSSLDDAVAQSLWFIRVFGTMFMIFGFVALFLASVGLYAVMSFSVSRRTREVGIRMALGRTGGRDVIRMVFGQGLLQLAVGMGIGAQARAGHLAADEGGALPVQPRDPAMRGPAWPPCSSPSGCSRASLRPGEPRWWIRWSRCAATSVAAVRVVPNRAVTIGWVGRPMVASGANSWLTGRGLTDNLIT